MRREVRKWSLKEDESDLDNVDANSVKSEEGGDSVDPLGCLYCRNFHRSQKIKGGFLMENSKFGLMGS